MIPPHGRFIPNPSCVVIGFARGTMSAPSSSRRDLRALARAASYCLHLSSGADDYRLVTSLISENPGPFAVLQTHCGRNGISCRALDT